MRVIILVSKREAKKAKELEKQLQNQEHTPRNS